VAVAAVAEASKFPFQIDHIKANLAKPLIDKGFFKINYFT
jgi:hypothetical protein